MKITLNDIRVSGSRLEYVFEYDEILGKYFSGEPFVIEYEESIEQVPMGVLAIPFVTNILPIVWITDSELVLDELDKDFYDSIPEFKQGYINMYPETQWGGTLNVKNVVDCKTPQDGGVCAFFSGGVDATTTLLRHYDEKPDLLTIWGSDITFDNEHGWNTMYSGLAETASRYNLPLKVIRSSFRKFDNEGVLHEEFSSLLKDGWWHGVKHGIALIGHAAPYIWLKHKKCLYIASSNSPADGKVRCASDPTIDNHVKFCSGYVCHDGFELGRQKKIQYIANYLKHNDVLLKLHVCWQSSDGENCCACEKCYRTIIAFYVCGMSPEKLGFNFDKSIFEKIYSLMALEYDYGMPIAREWGHIQKALRANWDKIQNKPFAKDLQWMLTYDFGHPEQNECRAEYLKKIMPWRNRLMLKFPKLYGIYRKIKYGNKA